MIIEEYRSRTFGFASRNFYPAFLAAVDIDADPEQYFGPLQRNPAANYTVLEIDAYYPAGSPVPSTGTEIEHAAYLQPGAARIGLAGGTSTFPRASRFEPPTSLETPARSVNLASVEHYDTQRPDEYHRVQRGEALSVIASQYGVSVRPTGSDERPAQPGQDPRRNGAPPAPSCGLGARPSGGLEARNRRCRRG